MRISDGSSDVCSSDLAEALGDRLLEVGFKAVRAADGLQSLSQRYRSPLGELQIVTQVMHRLGRRPREIDHRRIEARADHPLGGRPGDRHVAAPLASLADQGAALHLPDSSPRLLGTATTATAN